MTNKIYVCYEKNRNSLLMESEEIEEVFATTSIYKALTYVMKRLEKGIQDGFILDEEEKCKDRDEIEKALQNNEELNLTMFFEKQENWDCSYDINIKTIDA